MPKRAEMTEVSMDEVQIYIVLCGEGTLVSQWEWMEQGEMNSVVMSIRGLPSLELWVPTLLVVPVSSSQKQMVSGSSGDSGGSSDSEIVGFDWLYQSQIWKWYFVTRILQPASSPSLSNPLPNPTPTLPKPPIIPSPMNLFPTTFQDLEQWEALVQAYLQDHPKPKPPANNNDNNMPKLKAGLPKNFFGNEEDANLWLLSMKAYFTLNLALYEDKPWNKILAFLNKMDQGHGKSFTEGWLIKCGDPAFADTIFEKIEEDFKKKFIPTNQASQSQHTLADMRQEDNHFKGNFHKFKVKFELEAAHSGVTDEYILKDMLGHAISANLAYKMTALLKEPAIHKELLKKAGQFYDAALQMKKLWGGKTYIPPAMPRKNQHNPMAMDVNWLYFTPVQQAEHICNNKCFICHKIGCSTQNHPGVKGKTPTRLYLPQNQCPHNIYITKTLGTPPTNMMCSNCNMSNADVLRSLQIIFDNTVNEEGEKINILHLDEGKPEQGF